MDAQRASGTPRRDALARRWRPGRRGIAAIALGGIVLAGCGGGTQSPADEPPADEQSEAAGDQPADPVETDAPDEPDAEPAEDEDVPSTPAVDPAEVDADELGQVPVLMYHRLLEDGGGDYDLTPEEFRDELTWLFEHGYSPVLLKDLARGEIDVPAGRSPVALTFDDSTREQAALTEDGELDPDTAIGILVEVAAKYDEVEPRASLYVITSSLFGGGADGPDILAHLHELGMEIGNHTHTHPNLSQLSSDEVQEELARNVAEVQRIVPEAEVVTLSLPLGQHPEHTELAAAGSSTLGDYLHEGILLVGSGPTSSPFAGDFDALAIPRIRTSPSWDGGEPDFGSAFWLEQLDADGSYRRFVSDGDPDVISFPERYAEELDPDHAERANPY